MTILLYQKTLTSGYYQNAFPYVYNRYKKYKNLYIGLEKKSLYILTLGNGKRQVSKNKYLVSSLFNTIYYAKSPDMSNN